MAKTKPIRTADKPAETVAGTATTVAGAATETRKPSREPPGKAIRETIESFVVAFVLAFLFRTFEAEAFVIPTGSMAPTLQGRHLDVECSKCGYRYRAGATLDESVQSQANDPEVTLQEREYAQRKMRGREVIAVTCPMCRYELPVEPGTKGGEENPPYNGDRILVAKFPYDFSEPQRWDVFVFKYPGDAKMNYIKRLVGLPNESLRIYHGDIATKAPDAPDSDFKIVRKPPRKLLAMLQPVYDNDYVDDQLNAAGWPLRWQSAPASADAPAWQSDDKGRSFAIEGKAGETTWLDYRHYVPSRLDWRAIHDGELARQSPPRPQLITDFYAYNDVVTREYGGVPYNHTLGMHWVGDLKVDFELKVEKAAGTVVCELVKGGRHFQASIDLATGKAALSIDGLDDYHPQAQTGVRSSGRYRLGFANVDEQLSLWVDGRLVEFDVPTSYDPLGNDNPTADDLEPVRIGADGAAVRVDHLNLWRDIYYIAVRRDQGGSDVIIDWPPDAGPSRLDGPDQLERFLDFFSDPTKWESHGPDSPNPFALRRKVVFTSKADEFLALGDNSPYSADSRLWKNGPFVDRPLLIGKAVFIYWPHYWPWKYSIGIPFRGEEFRFPFWPNFRRMGFVR